MNTPNATSTVLQKTNQIARPIGANPIDVSCEDRTASIEPIRMRGQISGTQTVDEHSETSSDWNFQREDGFVMQSEPAPKPAIAPAKQGPFVPIDQMEPIDYDPSLFGCTFGPLDKADKLKNEHVLDATGKNIGGGRTREQACWLAAKVSRAQMQRPEHFHPTLKGCSFGIDAQSGIAIRTVTVVDDTHGLRCLGTGPDKESACHQARLTMMREKPIQNLTRDEFSLMCVVVTVQLARGKSGNAQDGPLWLRPEPRVVSSGISDLRRAIRLEAELAGININERVHWGEERLAEIMTSKLQKGNMHHIELGGCQHIILRTYESQPAAKCCSEVYDEMCAQAIEDAANAEQQKQFSYPRPN